MGSFMTKVISYVLLWNIDFYRSHAFYLCYKAMQYFGFENKKAYRDSHILPA